MCFFELTHSLTNIFCLPPEVNRRKMRFQKWQRRVVSCCLMVGKEGKPDTISSYSIMTSVMRNVVNLLYTITCLRCMLMICMVTYYFGPTISWQFLSLKCFWPLTVLFLAHQSLVKFSIIKSYSSDTIRRRLSS